ncbi:uncharacterized protein LOC142209165 [Leptodactylus fuscus]|uniref:uncharacterized protein LOC142209165 n=1 Tax=Leptodactylus fuscus TaxID=238119 RepID=UPI003F4EA540
MDSLCYVMLLHCLTVEEPLLEAISVSQLLLIGVIGSVCADIRKKRRILEAQEAQGATHSLTMKILLALLCMFSALVCSGNNTYQSILKGCGNELCNNTGMATQDDVMYRFRADCCKGELCNTHEYQLPKEDLRPNGRICPSCLLIGTTEECVTAKTMNCTGPQDQCFTYRAVVRTPDGEVNSFSVQDCSNRFTCKFNFDENIGIEEISRDDLSCEKLRPNADNDPESMNESAVFQSDDFL